MKRSLFLVCAFSTTLALLCAGCPLWSADEDSGVPSSSGTPGLSTRPGSTGTGSSLTPGSTGDSGREVPGSSTGDSTSVVDSLSLTYPACTESATGAAWRADILRLVNQERVSRGIDPVSWSETLEAQATQYACEMIQYDFFDHHNPFTGSSLGDRAEEFDYAYWIIGENLAAGQDTPTEAFAGWMESPCHRENVLNPAFTELGVGVRVGGSFGLYWVQEFGRPFSEPPYEGPLYEDPECDHDH